MSALLLSLLGALAPDPLLAGHPFVLRGHTDLIGAVAFSPDGRRLASAGSDRVVRVWELESGRVVLELKGPEKMVTSLAFSADGARLAAGDAAYQVHLWTLASGAPLPTVVHPEGIADVAFSPDGALLAVGGLLGGGGVYGVADGKLRLELRAVSARYSADGRQLLTATRTGGLEVLDAQTGKVVRKAESAPRVSRLSWAADGKVAVGWAGEADVLQAWDAATLKPLAPFATPRREGARKVPLVFAALTPDGKLAATCGADGALRVWDVAPRAVKHSFPMERGGVVALSPDGRWVAVGDGTLVKLWRLGVPDAG